MPSSAQLGRVFLSASAAVFTALAYASALSLREYPFRLYDGDFVHPHLLLRDFASGGSIFDWSSSAALYAFPDWLFALTALLPIDSRLAIQLSSLILLTALIYAGGRIVRTYMVGAATWQAAIFYGLAITGVTLIGGWPIQWLIDYAASIYIHTGATLILLLSIPYARDLFLGRDRTRNTVVLSILCLLTTFSDPIYLVWFAGPLILTAAATRSTASTGYATIIAGAGILAFIAERLKPFPSAEASLFIASPWEALEILFFQIQQGLEVNNVALIIYILAGLSAFATLVVSFWSTTRMPTERSLQDLLLASATVIAILLPVVAGAIDHGSKIRYMIPIVYLAPLLVLSALLFLAEGRRLQRFTPVAVGLLALVLALYGPRFYDEIQSGQHADLIACLDEHKLTDGHAHYDFAKAIIVLSDGRIHLSQTGYSGGINFSRRLHSHKLNGMPLVPNFVIADRLTPEELAPFGQPASVITCADTEIWLLDTSGQAALPIL